MAKRNFSQKSDFWSKSHFKFDKSIIGQKAFSAEQLFLPKRYFWQKKSVQRAIWSKCNLLVQFLFIAISGLRAISCQISGRFFFWQIRHFWSKRDFWPKRYFCQKIYATFNVSQFFSWWTIIALWCIWNNFVYFNSKTIYHLFVTRQKPIKCTIVKFLFKTYAMLPKQ